MRVSKRMDISGGGVPCRISHLGFLQAAGTSVLREVAWARSPLGSLGRPHSLSRFLLVLFLRRTEAVGNGLSSSRMEPAHWSRLLRSTNPYAQDDGLNDNVRSSTIDLASEPVVNDAQLCTHYIRPHRQQLPFTGFFPKLNSAMKLTFISTKS